MYALYKIKIFLFILAFFFPLEQEILSYLVSDNKNVLFVSEVFP